MYTLRAKIPSEAAVFNDYVIMDGFVYLKGRRA